MNVLIAALVFILIHPDAFIWAKYDVYWDSNRHWFGAKEDCIKKNGSYSYIQDQETWINITSNGGQAIHHIYRSVIDVVDICPGNTYNLSIASTSCLSVFCNRSLTVCNNDTVVCYTGHVNSSNEIHWQTPGFSTDIPSTTNTTSYVTQNTKTSDVCDNCCEKKNKSKQINPDELRNRLHELRLQTAINKGYLSSRRRKFVSVYDSRPSSVFMGCLAIIFLTTTIGLLVVPDIANLAAFLQK